MHGELFQSRCDQLRARAFPDARLYESAAEHRRVVRRPHPAEHVWFGEVPFHMERIIEELQRCTVMLVIGTSGVVQPAANFVRWASRATAAARPVRTSYVGPDNRQRRGFTRVFESRAGALLPELLRVR